MESVLRERLSLLAAIGCGVALGVTGIYTYYLTNREINNQINSLTNTIEDLKKEVKDLRIASIAASVASLTHSPIHSIHSIHSNQFDFNPDNIDNPGPHDLIRRLNCSSADYADNRCQMDGLLTSPPVDNSVSTDDNEEFFEFTEGETESEQNVSMNCENSVSVPDIETDISLEEWLKQYDRLLNDTSVNKKELYQQIISVQTKYGNSGEIFWRSAKATHLYGIAAQKDGNSELKKKLAFETLDYAKKAIECDDTNSECHKWYAIAIGSLSDYITTKEKISNGHQFKKHVDIGLQLKPNDPSLHHMLGRFCFEISNLTWVEKKIASALFSKVPESSYDDSLNHLLKAYDLRPDWKENILFIAKILTNQKKYSEAIKWIDRGLAIEAIGEDDAIADEQLVSLNSKHLKYR